MYRIKQRGAARIAAILGGAAALLATGFVFASGAVPVSAHHIDTGGVQGTVDCQGDYSITVTGDVYGTVKLVVTLGGNKINDAVTGQVGDKDGQTYGPFTGTGATAGEAIAAWPSDNAPKNGKLNGEVDGSLVLNVESCSTPTPTPTPTPVVITFQTTCGGSVTFAGVPEDEYVTIGGGDLSGNVQDNSPASAFALDPSANAYNYWVHNNGDASGGSGSFTISACVVTTPTPTPTPEMTPPPVPGTGAGRG